MTIFNKVWFRAYQSDEGTDFNDGSAPVTAGSEITADGYFLFSADTLSGGVDTYDPTILWVGTGTDASNAVAGQLQGVFPFYSSSFGMTDWGWWTLFSTDTDPTTSPVIVPETWYHVSLYTKLYAGPTIDYSLTVDGVEIYNEIGVDLSFLGDVGSVIPQAGYGQDGSGAHANGTAYVDNAAVNGSTIDTFEGGSLAAWDDQTGDVAISTDFAFAGTHSLKTVQVYAVDNVAAFVVKQL